ncbi:hypothetical protein [Agromyces larvae]|uniref:Helix-turn-helix domain-containing protein n=1 Tax=Agromyces larvae TaxID=2929802 RepID=A0ABY4C293_9MICO|nr:hypothetical protein [Agromyces larvae]UOE45134.1 hypothetical protein MTO99_04965 [Agromyces larvae]
MVAAAKALGITRQTAGKLLADAGVGTVRRMSQVDIARAREAHAASESARSIGRRLGFSTHTILKAIRDD